MTDGRELLGFLSSRVLIVTHAMPDGDAAGSVFGLSGLVRAKGGQAVCLFPELPAVFRYLAKDHDARNTVDPSESFDAVFILDCGSASQVAGGMESLPAGPERIVIDHHRTREPFGDREWVDATASATGVLVGELVLESGCEITPDIARPLWCAILTDTGSFRYSSTDARTLRLGSRLLEGGADPWEAAQNIYESLELSRQHLLGMCLGTLQVRSGGKVAGMHLTREMVERSGAAMDASSGFINYARSIAGVEIAFLVRQDDREPDLWRVAFRSRGTFPVDTIAAGFGGGGHKNASGCRMTGTCEQVLEQIFSAIRDLGVGE